jgi:hypothetical protein
MKEKPQDKIGVCRRLPRSRVLTGRPPQTRPSVLCLNESARSSQTQCTATYVPTSE